MKETVILPSQTIDEMGSINKVVYPHFIMGTTAGLVKQNNEDTIGCSTEKDFLRMCIADGHWGDGASRLIVKHWLKNQTVFPHSFQEAVKETAIIEEQLFNAFGTSHMDPNKDFTPEASFIALEIIKDDLSIVSYGDCRLLIAHNGITTYSLEGKSTWLGAFSHLQIRERLSVHQATIFGRMQVHKEDYIFLFTDGVDQCVYEKDTLSFDFISSQSKHIDITRIFDKVMDEVFMHGAEDNASLGIFKL